MITNIDRRSMTWNPKTQNLLQSTDISDALDKAIDYLDSVDNDDAHIHIPSTKPFALKMRMYKFMRAYHIQMKSNDEVDEHKYSHLKITEDDEGIKISSALEQEKLTLTTDKGEVL